MAVEKNFDGEILLSTLWSQVGVIECGGNKDVEFNKYSPLDPLTGNHSATGCGNTAMGQVIYYFLENGLLENFDLTLTAQDAYTNLSYGLKRLIPITAEGNEETGTLSFAEINEMIKTFIAVPTDPAASDYIEKSTAAAEYVAALNYACGVVNATGYSALTGSGSLPTGKVYERAGFASYMPLSDLSDKERTRWFRKEGEKQYLTEEALEIVVENLLDGRPISVAIDGHFIVLDGYDSKNDKFHLNYGWGKEGGGSVSEGSAANTRWYRRDELPAIHSLELELRGSYIEEFTVTDSRFFGAGTFMSAVEKANAMQGSNVITFSDTMTLENIELPHAYRLQDELVIKGFNLTVCGAFPAEEAVEQQEEKNERFLFGGDTASRIRFEDFSGSAVFQTEAAQEDSIFNFTNSIRSELFFSEAKLYSGKTEDALEDAEILTSLEGDNLAELAEMTQKAMIVSASSGDDTIKFDQQSISVGNIDLDDGFNILIVENGSQIYGDIAGSGANNIFIDSSSGITGALMSEAKLFFTVNTAEKQTPVFTITGDAAETLGNIAGLTVDTTNAAAGEYLLIAWETSADITLECEPEIIGDGQLELKESGLVLTVTEPNEPLPQPDSWSVAHKIDGNMVTLNWSEFANAAGYVYRYAKDMESLAGNGTVVETNSAVFLLNNGTWYCQVRAIDSDGNYSAWTEAAEITVNNVQEAKTDSYLANGIGTDLVIDSEFTVLSGGILSNVCVSADGNLTLEKGSITTGTLSIKENGSVEAFSGAGFLFDLSDLTGENQEGFIDNYAAVNGTLQFAIAVSEEQPLGTYILAENVAEWEYPLEIKVKAKELLLGTLGEEKKEFIYEDKSYSLDFSKDAKQLLFSVTEAIQTETAEDGSTGLRWHAPAGAGGYVVEISKSENFDSNIQLVVSEKNNLEIITPLEEECFWRVQAPGYDDGFIEGGKIDSGTFSADPQIYEGKGAEQDVSLFFARSSGKWGAGYVARHMDQDGELVVRDVVLEGKARYQDIFLGNKEEASADILYLSDDENGDAFFTDDIYSAFPDNEARGRFAEISHIYAGAGDDIIDMTSARYESANADIFLHGGAGNDVLWSDSASFLFGDEGNDTIIGSDDTDYISGGAGDDILHGGGGNDFFLYGAPDTWGNDVIFQRSGGSINLLFAKEDPKDILETIERTEDPDTITTVYRYDENNSITIRGAMSDQIGLIDPNNVEKFDKAYAAGGFEASSSVKVFQESPDDKGVLA